MSVHTKRKYINVCPRNCPSTCTMVSYVENDELVHITGDSNNTYTKGKLCAKGFSYIERNRHRDRLKYPYYQAIKGSGKFKQITWEKAYEIIISEMKKMNERYNSFLPLALYKGSGNIGIHHYVTDEFFANLGETTRILSSSSLLRDSQGHQSGIFKATNPSQIVDSSLVIIWGANPAASNIHFIPFLIEAKMKGAKMVVIDPTHTQTADLADLFIQLRPGTDASLAKILTKKIINGKTYDRNFLEQETVSFDDFARSLENLNLMEHLERCDIPSDALNIFLHWLTEASTISFVIGTGLYKHRNVEISLRSIEDLVAVNGGRSSVFYYHSELKLFKNQLYEDKSKQRQITIHDVLSFNSPTPIEMLWITCANPLIQEANTLSFKKWMEDIPFIVTVDQFFTPTALMSNLVLPTTTHFEEFDIVVSPWQESIKFNERAISPYYESKSDWNLLNKLAIEMKKQSLPCTFPIYSSEEEYLNAQFNKRVYDHFAVRSIADLMDVTSYNNHLRWKQESRKEKYHFQVERSVPYEHHTIDLGMDETLPPKEYPFWLLTPHHPYTLNSQFHYLNLSDEREAVVGIHPNVAKNLGIDNGEIVRVFNQLGSIEIKAVYSTRVPKDIIFIYQGWYPVSQISINHLISEMPLTNKREPSTFQCVPFYDTFVSIEKV